MKTSVMACPRCKSDFTYPVIEFAGREIYLPEACQHCLDRARESESRANAKAKLAEREFRWSKICPASFWETDPARLPVPDLLKQVLNWSMRSRGLLLIGPTRQGKTRCAWQLLKREHFAGRKIGYVGAYEVASYAAKLMASSHEANSWLEAVVRADLTLLDDVFKPKMTERAEELIYLVVDERTSRGRPIIVTMNEAAEAVQAKLSQEGGAPLVGRIRDFCEVIAF